MKTHPWLWLEQTKTERVEPGDESKSLHCIVLRDDVKQVKTDHFMLRIYKNLLSVAEKKDLRVVLSNQTKIKLAA